MSECFASFSLQASGFLCCVYVVTCEAFQLLQITCMENFKAYWHRASRACEQIILEPPLTPPRTEKQLIGALLAKGNIRGCFPIFFPLSISLSRALPHGLPGALLKLTPASLPAFPRPASY